ncbi:hypothetical protein BsWGS_05748 [Bradybaena similaris]
MNRLYHIVSPMCACGQDEQTAGHVLQVCPLYNHQRRTFWPSGLAFHSKMNGTSNYNRVHHKHSSDFVNIQQAIERRRIDYVTGHSHDNISKIIKVTHHRILKLFQVQETSGL